MRGRAMKCCIVKTQVSVIARATNKEATIARRQDQRGPDRRYSKCTLVLLSGTQLLKHGYLRLLLVSLGVASLMPMQAAHAKDFEAMKAEKEARKKALREAAGEIKSSGKDVAQVIINNLSRSSVPDGTWHAL